MNREVLIRRARRHGWEVENSAESVIILRRQGWRLDVTFADNVPLGAHITGPCYEESRPVNLRSINAVLSAALEEMPRRTRAAIIGGRTTCATNADL